MRGKLITADGCVKYIGKLPGFVIEIKTVLTYPLKLEQADPKDFDRVWNYRRYFWAGQKGNTVIYREVVE